MLTATLRIEIDEDHVDNLSTARAALWSVGIENLQSIGTTWEPSEFQVTIYDLEPGDLVEGESFTANIHRDTDDTDTFVSVYVVGTEPE